MDNTDLMPWLITYSIGAVLMLVQAFVGGFLIWNLRDDEEECFLGIRMKRLIWTLLAVALGGFLMRFYTSPNLIDNWRIWVSMGLLWWTWSYAHGPMLQGWKQLCSDTPDLIERALMALLNLKPGQPMGKPMFLLYRLIRYVLPYVGIAALLREPVVAIAGVLICLGYQPLARWTVRAAARRALHLESKIVGAGYAGAFGTAIFFAMVL